MKYTKSKPLQHGDLAALYGNKFIRCARNRLPVGIWQDAQTRKYLTLTGDHISVNTPTGIQQWGEARVNSPLINVSAFVNTV